MATGRYRAWAYAGLALGITWALALGGYFWASHSRVTAEKVSAYVQQVDLSRLQGEQRQRAIDKLAAQLNALSLEERRRLREEGAWRRWFEAMTEEEKARFIEATLPTGFRQMLTAFEQLPEEKRRQAIEQAMDRLQRRRQQLAQSGGPALAPPNATNAPALSPELQEKVIRLGLREFYSQSSAQTKAELAPLLEEMQRLMESGRLFRQRYHR